MRRKATRSSFPLPSDIARIIIPRRIRSSMQCSGRVWTVVLFVGAYLTFTLFLARVEHTCPSLEQLVMQEDNQPVAYALQQVVKAVNSSINDDIRGPLVKLGINLPIEAPPMRRDAAIPEPTMFATELQPHTEILRSEYAPNNVFYIWCGRRWFEFPHYLSVMSVIRELRPDNIIFFYDTYPVVDSWTYNTWFEEIRQEFPFFRLWPLDEKDKREACQNHAKVSLKFIHALLSYRGGMYIHESTILTSFPQRYRNHSMVHALQDTGAGFIVTRKGIPNQQMSVEDVLKSPRHSTMTFQCSTIDKFNLATTQPICVNTGPTFFPKDIWELDSPFGQLVRKVFYGDSAMHQLEQNYDELIPNIAHIVWLGGGPMDFLFYLCVLSLVYVADVERVYIHGDAPPTGPYWDRVKDDPRVTLIYRDSPVTIYGNKVEVISHVTDIWRVDFMIKYGGIYVDTDTVFVKPLDREIRAYDAVGSYDWTYWNHPFPDTINFGVAIGKRNAKFWREFQKSMKWFMDKDWSWNGLRQPYRIQERQPHLVRIDPHLQVICFEAKCHPTWVDNYHDEAIHHLNTNSIKSWLNDTYAFHWTLPTPDELLNEENLMKSDSIFAEIGKHILKKAGRLH